MQILQCRNDGRVAPGEIGFAFFFSFLLILLTGTIETALAQAGPFEAYTQPIPGSDQSNQMTPVQGGTFTMGSPPGEQGREEDEGPAHRVRVDSFWMGIYEITWDQYDLFVDEKLDS